MWKMELQLEKRNSRHEDGIYRSAISHSALPLGRRQRPAEVCTYRQL